LSIVIALNLYVLVGDIFTNDSDFDILDIGSTIVITLVLYVLFLPGMFLHFYLLRWMGIVNRSPRVGRVLAVVTSPVVATILFVLAAASGDSEGQGSTWIAALGATTIFGLLVRLPQPRQADTVGDRSTADPVRPIEG
jgi:hypothetical protein